MLYKRSMWSRIAQKSVFFVLFKQRIYTHTKTHFTRLSLHGLNNKHVIHTTSVSFKFISSKNYSKNSFKQSLSRFESTADTSKMQGQVPAVRRKWLTPLWFVGHTNGENAHAWRWRHQPIDRYVSNLCDSTECSFPICVSTCMQIHRHVCNSIPSSMGYGKHRVDVFDLNARVDNVTPQSVPVP